MHIKRNQQLKLLPSIRQLLNASMIQMMNMFQLSFTSLCDEIDRRAEENVFLEVAQGDNLSASAYQLGDDVSDYAKSIDDYGD